MDLHGFLVVDKPGGLTSHDVVAHVRRLLHTRKIGHAGTLDPAAEGVLVLAIGRATKLLPELSTSSKVYAAHMVLGVESQSGDIEGPATSPVRTTDTPSDRAVLETLDQFLGEIEQVPPAHSAIKVEGQPLYRRVRRGEEVVVPTRRVTISALRVLHYRFPDLFVEIECSSGTYIRSLARDIGSRLGCGAYLHHLIRLGVGQFRLEHSWPLDTLQQELNSANFSHFALHPAWDADFTRAMVLEPENVNAWYDGRPVAPRDQTESATMVHAFGEDGLWLGAGVLDSERNAILPKIVVHD